MKKANLTQIVFLPPPCSNGDLHFGHIAGVYLPADIFARVLKKISPDGAVITIAGADENNSYTLKKAIQTGKNYEESRDHFTQRIQKSLEFLNIYPDVFVRTSSDTHNKVANGIFNEISKRNCIRKESSSQLYSSTRKEFVVDSFGKGICYVCSTETDSGTCEKCGELIKHNKLISPMYYADNEQLILKETKAYFIQLHKIKNLILKDFAKQTWNKWIKGISKDWVVSPENKNVEITKIFPEGLQVSNSNIQSLSIPLWFEAVWAYYTGIYVFFKYENFQSFLYDIRSMPYEVFFFMGADNRFHFTVSDAIVRVLLGLKKFFTKVNIQPFLNINGKKFSTSRGRAVFVEEIERIFDPKFLRFSLYLHYCSSINDFTLQSFFHSLGIYRRLLKFLSTHEVIKNGLGGFREEKNIKYFLRGIRKEIKKLKFKSLLKYIEKNKKEIENAKSDDEFRASCCKLVVLLDCVLPGISEQSDLNQTIPTLRQLIDFVRLYKIKSNL